MACRKGRRKYLAMIALHAQSDWAGKKDGLSSDRTPLLFYRFSFSSSVSQSPLTPWRRDAANIPAVLSSSRKARLVPAASVSPAPLPSPVSPPLPPVRAGVTMPEREREPPTTRSQLSTPVSRVMS